MIDELNQALEDYQTKWQKLVNESANRRFFASLKPTAVAWKTTDRQELIGYFNELRDSCDQIHFGWINERWLVTMHLKSKKLAQGIQIVKLMERRPGSSDAVGLDHVDFYSEDKIESELAKATGLKWTKEMNGNTCKWISIWFENTEAKLRADTVLHPCIAELQETEAQVLNS